MDTNISPLMAISASDARKKKTEKESTIALRSINRDYTIRRGDGNENVKNSIRFSRQNNSYARASHIFVHFFALFARLRREIAWFYFFREDVNERRRNFIRSLNLNIVLTNSTPEGFAYIWQSKWVGIIVIKTEKTKIHFRSDVFAAVASSDRKGDITREDSQRRFLVQHSVAMLEQCCNHSKKYRSQQYRNALLS